MSNVEERILKAAEQCFATHGVIATQVQQIVEVAGIARSTFYRYFRDVDGVLLKIVIQLWVMHLQQVLEQTNTFTTPAQRWRGLIVGMASSGSELPRGNALFAEDSFLHIVRLVYRNPQNAQTHLIELMVPAIKKAQANQELRTDIGAQQIAEWLLRQAWALSSAPPVDGWQTAELDNYIDIFLLPGLLHPTPPENNQSAAIERLSRELQRLTCVVEKIDARII
jgi:AcrR family transcriptional regulator